MLGIFEGLAEGCTEGGADGGSTSLQAPQVTGHFSRTTWISHRFMVSLLATQSQETYFRLMPLALLLFLLLLLPSIGNLPLVSEISKHIGNVG